MNVNVRLPASMRDVMRDRGEVTVPGENVGAVIDALEREYAGIRQKLCDEQGRLRRFIAVFVNGVDVRTLQGMDTVIPPGGEVDIVSAIAGG